MSAPHSFPLATLQRLRGKTTFTRHISPAQCLEAGDSASLHQLFKDSLHELYGMLFDIDADALAATEEYYSAIAEARELAEDRQSIGMDP